jgi:predicted  nucleic acid-binding Zn-ribbon protein
MAVTQALLDLQALDLTIDRLGVRRRALEAGDEVAAARAAADETERVLGELGLSIDELDRDATKLEHEVDSLTRKAAAERARMSDGSVANARELEAIGREIANLDQRRSEREDELLVIMERRETVERDAAVARTRTEELRAAAAEAAGAAGAELTAVVAELETRATERASLAAGIDPELLELYEDLRGSKRGVGAAALVDGVCQGCHETLSSVELDRIKRADGIRRCEHCRRILVL